MLAIARAYFDIALLRRGPQSLPVSVALLLLTLVVNAALHAATTPLQLSSRALALVGYVVGTIMMLSVIWLLLDATGRRGRFVQTMTALLGVDNVLLLPELALLPMAPAMIAALKANQITMPALLLTALGAWRIVVASYVIRQAMSITVLQSLAVIVVILLLYVGALGLLLPLLGFGGA